VCEYLSSLANCKPLYRNESACITPLTPVTQTRLKPQPPHLDQRFQPPSIPSVSTCRASRRSMHGNEPSSLRQQCIITGLHRRESFDLRWCHGVSTSPSIQSPCQAEETGDRLPRMLSLAQLSSIDARWVRQARYTRPIHSYNVCALKMILKINQTLMLSGLECQSEWVPSTEPVKELVSDRCDRCDNQRL